MIDTTKLYSVQTEVQVISACIFETFIYDYVRELLSPELFTDYDCVEAYKVIM